MSNGTLSLRSAWHEMGVRKNRKKNASGGNESHNKKSAEKRNLESAKKTAVRDYGEKYDKASKASDLADKKWNKVSEQYKALGKNKISRIIAAAKNQSKAAKAYNKNYETASKMSDAADRLWGEASAAYKKIGRNRVERMINYAKYR